MKKPMHAAALSAVIWGSGQLYNKQFVKGIVLLILQAILIGVELFSGNYFSGTFEFRETGFFLSGIWGMITLGTETPELTMDGLVGGDHSIMLLIQGIIAALILFVFALIWIGNIKDAHKTAKEFNETGEVISSRRWLRETWEKSFEYIVMILPALMLMMFILMPIIFSAAIAFTNYNTNNLPPGNLVNWTGLNNFRIIFSLGDAWLRTFIHVFIWTTIFATLGTLLPFFFGLFQAVLLNNKRVKFKKFWRSILILPWAVPGIISLLNFQQILNGTFGPLNRFLMNRGIMETPIFWLSDSNNIWIPRMTIILIQIWLAMPYFMALMSGIMTSISQDIYEAAEIDGANEHQQFWKITLPLVVAATAPLIVMSFAHNFNNFGIIYFLTQGTPVNPSFINAGSTDILISWIFKLTVDEQLFNFAAVFSIIIFLIIGGISAWNFTKMKAFKEEL